MAGLRDKIKSEDEDEDKHENWDDDADEGEDQDKDEDEEEEEEDEDEDAVQERIKIIHSSRHPPTLFVSVWVGSLVDHHVSLRSCGLGPWGGW